MWNKGSNLLIFQTKHDKKHLANCLGYEDSCSEQNFQSDGVTKNQMRLRYHS